MPKFLVRGLVLAALLPVLVGVVYAAIVQQMAFINGDEYACVYCAVFSPDGQRVVTASADGTARVWDGRTGLPLTPPLRHDGGSVYDAAFSPDGRRIVTGCSDGTVVVWKTATGERSFTLHPGWEVYHVEFSRDGRRVLAHGSPEPGGYGPFGSTSGGVRIWDATSGAPLAPALKSGAGVSHAEFSPDSRRLITVSLRTETSVMEAHVCDARSGAMLFRVLPMRANPAIPSYATFSRDGRRIVTVASRKGSTSGEIRVWNAATGKPVGLRMPHSVGAESAEFSPDGRRILSCGEGGSLQVWDAATGRSVGAALCQGPLVESALFSPDSRKVVTAADDRTANVWDVATGRRVIPPLSHRKEVYDARFSPDGSRIVTACGDGTAHLWDAATGTPIGRSMRHHAEDAP